MAEFSLRIRELHRGDQPAAEERNRPQMRPMVDSCLALVRLPQRPPGPVRCREQSRESSWEGRGKGRRVLNSRAHQGLIRQNAPSFASRFDFSFLPEEKAGVSPSLPGPGSRDLPGEQGASLRGQWPLPREPGVSALQPQGREGRPEAGHSPREARGARRRGPREVRGTRRWGTAPGRRGAPGGGASSFLHLGEMALFSWYGCRALPGLQEVKQTSACPALFSVAGRGAGGHGGGFPNPVQARALPGEQPHSHCAPAIHHRNQAR